MGKRRVSESRQGGEEPVVGRGQEEDQVESEGSDSQAGASGQGADEEATIAEADLHRSGVN